MNASDVPTQEQGSDQAIRYVLFVCNHNAGRSQMAQAFFERYGPEDVRAESAGTEPAREIWPSVVAAMREIGFDLGGAQAEEADARDAASRRLGDHDGLRRCLPLRADDGRGLGHTRPGGPADRRGPSDP